MSTARLIETVRLFASGEEMTAADIAAWVGVTDHVARRYLELLNEALLIAPCGFDDVTGRAVKWVWRQRAGAPAWPQIVSDEMLTSKEAARRLGVSDETLRVWRCRGPHHIEHVKVGRFVRYSRKAIAEFIESGVPA